MNDTTDKSSKNAPKLEDGILFDPDSAYDKLIVDESRISAAQATLQSLINEYPEMVAPDVSNLQDLINATVIGKSKHIIDIYKMAHDFKGQGGSFGYSLVSLVGDAICQLIRDKSKLTSDQKSKLESLAEILTQSLLQQLRDPDEGAAPSPDYQRMQARILQLHK